MLTSIESEDRIFPCIPNFHGKAICYLETPVNPGRRWEDAGAVIIPQKVYDRWFIGHLRGTSVGAIIEKP
jgi:hypothetical protein